MSETSSGQFSVLSGYSFVILFVVLCFWIVYSVCRVEVLPSREFVFHEYLEMAKFTSP